MKIYGIYAAIVVILIGGFLYHDYTTQKSEAAPKSQLDVSIAKLVPRTSVDSPAVAGDAAKP